MVTRYIDGELVYDTDWWNTCCPTGHALRETGKAPHPKNVYLVNYTQKTILRKVCCPYCYTHYLNHPAQNGFASLCRATSNLKIFQVTQHLTKENQ